MTDGLAIVYADRPRKLPVWRTVDTDSRRRRWERVPKTSGIICRILIKNGVSFEIPILIQNIVSRLLLQIPQL
ncbi:UNVERIFIED_CONTAM: hypothetical protein PYX00_006841 [Menopon gallinae]|uniref:Uncharacterized protein n=1 Tax=Menopon gallinae TaxID=328185 RepID=A0AAW2HWJ1_9NEOP